MDDLISRAVACDEIGKMIHEYREKGDHDLADALILSRRYVLKQLPAVDAVPVEWLVAHETEYLEDWGAEPISVRKALALWQKEQEAR